MKGRCSTCPQFVLTFVVCFFMVSTFFNPSLVCADWQVINLHPDDLPNVIGSWASGVSEGRQVGWVDRTDGNRHAWLWNGSASSYVDLHPSWTGESFAQDVAGTQQVGSIRFWEGSEPREHAGIWSGTPESWISLHPLPKIARSVALCTDGVQQGGFIDIEGYFGAYRAALWSGTPESWVDLHPGKAYRSTVFGVYGGQQVGYAHIEAIHAALWSGSVESYTDLNPPGAVRSWGYDIWGNEQVGMVTVSDLPELVHAGLWRGTPESWVDLHPETIWPGGWSFARAVCRGWQAGYVQSDPAGPSRAALWHGSADTYLDLHAFLPDRYDSSQAWDIDVIGSQIWVVGYAHNCAAGRDEAVMWYIPEPATLLLLVSGGLMFLGSQGRRIRCSTTSN